MSSPAISGGTSLFTGFTRLCKGLAVVLVGGHIILQILPSSVDYLALIPASYMPISGFHGVLSGFLVGIKQILPDQELSLLKIKAKWLPSLSVLLSVVKNPETKHRGDPSDEFAFSTFFPEFLRPVIDPLLQYFIGCYVEELQLRMRQGVIPWVVPHCQIVNSALKYLLTPVDLINIIAQMTLFHEESVNEERGARALEERLAAEMLATGGKEEESKKDAVENFSAKVYRFRPGCFIACCRIGFGCQMMVVADGASTDPNGGLLGCGL
ncbi:hypothetical protein C3L33_17389, partial [Rhododendron williamsianum]